MNADSSGVISWKTVFAGLMVAAFFSHSPAIAQVPRDFKKDIENAIPAFSEISPGIYRSGAIPEDVFPFLSQYGIRTIINFDDRKTIAGREERALGYFGIQTYRFPWSTLEIPPVQVIEDTLAILKEEKFRPVLMHCRSGKTGAGLMTALYRMELEGWSVDDAYAEMKEKGFPEFSYGHLKKFLYDYAYRESGSRAPQEGVFQKAASRIVSGFREFKRFISF